MTRWPEAFSRVVPEGDALAPAMRFLMFLMFSVVFLMILHEYQKAPSE